MALVHAESGRSPMPVPFVTARRFWTLAYLTVATVLISMGLARVFGRPLMTRILFARQGYITEVKRCLAELVGALTKSLTALPGRKIVVDTKRHRLYIDTQTQTSAEDLSPEAEEINEEEASLRKSCTRLTILARSLTDLAGPDENRAYTKSFEATTAFKDSLQDLEASLYRKYDSSTNAYGAGSTKSSNDSVVQKIKAEIRSVKGSCLSLRAP